MKLYIVVNKAGAAKAALFIATLLIIAAVNGCDDQAFCSFETAADGNSTNKVCRDEDGDVLTSTPVDGCVVDKATELSDGTVELTCSNGSKVSVKPGQDGLPGNNGQDCEVHETSQGKCELQCAHTSVELACNTGSTGTGGTGGSGGTSGTATPYQVCAFSAPPAVNDPNAYLAVSDAYADGATSGLWDCKSLKLNQPVSVTTASVVFYAGKCADTIAVLGAVSGAVSWDVGHATFSGSTSQVTYADFGSNGCAVALGGGNAQVAILPFGKDWPAGASWYGAPLEERFQEVMKSLMLDGVRLRGVNFDIIK